MPSLPRIITVDPTGNAARIVRSVIDITEYACRQVDVPSGAEAIEEMELGGSQLIVSSLNLEDMSALALVEQAQNINAQAGIVILADIDDPEMSLEEQKERGFIYLQRPVDVQIFTQVMVAGMRGENLFDALRRPAGGGGRSEESYTPVPVMDLDRAGGFVESLVTELGAMSVLLLTRDGEVLLEKGATNFIEHEALTAALIPSAQSNISMRNIVGGSAPTLLQFYDGEDRDVYTLSVGLHHMLCIAYDGERGQREFGMVNRFGRKIAQDLIALVGAEAFYIQKAQPEAPKQQVDDLPRRTIAVSKVKLEELEEEVHLERASEFSFGEENDAGGAELERVQMDAIEDFDESILDQLDKLDMSAADDLFSLDSLENMNVQVKSNRTITQQEARELGLLDN